MYLVLRARSPGTLQRPLHLRDVHQRHRLRRGRVHHLRSSPHTDRSASRLQVPRISMGSHRVLRHLCRVGPEYSLGTPRPGARRNRNHAPRLTCLLLLAPHEEESDSSTLRSFPPLASKIRLSDLPCFCTISPAVAIVPSIRFTRNY